MKEIDDLQKRVQKEQDTQSGVVIFSIVLIIAFYCLRAFFDFSYEMEITPLALGFIIMGLAIQNKRMLKLQTDLIRLIERKS